MPHSKRFYLDDGDARRRWQVRLSGKSQFVEHGRLGAKLRETTKTFSSAREALSETEKLTAAKQREGYIEIEPGLLEITKYKGRKGASERQIASLEKRVGCRLPDEY